MLDNSENSWLAVALLKITVVLLALMISPICYSMANLRLLPPCTGNDESRWDECLGQKVANAGWVYEGAYKGGSIVYGTLMYPDGRFYIGSMKAGLPDGEGKFFDKQGGLIGLGRWSEGKLMKEEPLFLSNLSTCPGDPRRTFTACFGVERFPDGSYYSGEWLNGRWNGLGVSGGDAGRWENGILKERLNLPREFYPQNGLRPSSAVSPPAHLLNLPNKSTQGHQLTESGASDRLTLEAAKRKCVDIGFKAGSEQYGKCVLQLSK